MGVSGAAADREEQIPHHENKHHDARHHSLAFRAFLGASCSASEEQQYEQ